VQNHLSYSLLSRNFKTKIYRTIILPVVLYGYETWSLTLREEHKLRLFENRALRGVYGPKGGQCDSTGEDYIMSSLMICTAHQLLFRWSNQED
jgi:hypothetical protein